MTRAKKKIYATVLGVALVAAVADRLLVSQPASTEAAEIPVVLAVPELAADAATATDGPQGNPTRPLFPRNLPSADLTSLTRNPFQLPPKLAKRLSTRLSGDSPVDETAPIRLPGEPLSVEHFSRVHSLMGVLVGEFGAAIVDNETIEVGQKFDESELLRVAGEWAYFQCADGVADMKVEECD